ncbi:hypothetical protein EDD22DRAFT_446132 [Suillus occidentalis]|nr:hypothetical protein EDD22DRAFT_200031 [Suillus occidentalis]KAG1764669.1 hypothetical protein EDD22DRAFT_446132 [Suillus occidentalis]
MPKSTNYTCSAAAGCNETFAKIADFRKHEARHSPHAFICTWPGCDFATLVEPSYDVHYAKHTGEQRNVCPHDDCDYKTHNPSLLTLHRKKCHGHVPPARKYRTPVRKYRTPSATESGLTQSSSQPQSTQSQPLPPIHNPLGVLHGPADTADDYTM